MKNTCLTCNGEQHVSWTMIGPIESASSSFITQFFSFLPTSHHDPNDNFSDPDLDDTPEDIDDKRPVEGENANPYSTGNTDPGIVIRNSPRSFMTDVDPDVALAHDFLEYTNIVPAHLLNDEFDDEELFVATLMPRMGLRQAKQIEARHVYVKAVRKAMAVNSRRAQTMNAEFYSRDLETFRVQEYISRHSGLPPRSYVVDLRNRQYEIYMLQRTLRIWGNEFPVIRDVSNWEVPPPALEMVPDSSLCRHLKDRPQSTRTRNDMDVRETGEPKLCTVCRTSRLNRSTCSHCVYVSGQSSRNVRLEDDE
ncbi:hypothetical protein GOBAR_DD26285 [Gossypium barbadense]|nr:hypothetical protein GOBAR_DD26285 [Gossypium barbadense]